MRSLPLAWRFARRELRGGVRGFRIFLACLALGVAAIAGVGSLSEAINQGIRADATKILGGDVDLRLTHQPATAEQRAWLDRQGRVSAMAEMRAMATIADGGGDGEGRRLIELKAVDAAYPLYGSVALSGGMTVDAALAHGTTPDGAPDKALDEAQEALWGAAVEPALADRLGVAVGDVIRIGEGRFRIRAVISREPDRSTQAFTLGPRVLIAMDALEATGLLLPGSLIRYHYRIALPEGTSLEGWKRVLAERFPDAGWRVRDSRNATPGIQRFLDRVGMFLTLVGLTALLVGGVGVGNAVRTYLATKATTAATLKCLGAPGQLVFQVYLLQVLALAAVGIAIGVTLGAAAPLVAAPALAGQLPVEARFGIYGAPLLRAALFGVLVTLVFSLWPLGRARDVPAANLFRSLVAPVGGRPRWPYLVALAAVAAALAALAVLGADERWLAAFFVLGTLGTFGAFAAAAAALTALARRIPRPRWSKLRLALANLYRPGAPTTSVVLSLGLGITVLVAVALVESNLSRQVSDSMPGEVPGYFFIDIQPDQVAAFDELVGGFAGVERMVRVPMMRGRIVSLRGTPVEEIVPPSEYAWILRGDRGITWSRTAPETGSRVVSGRWWEPDYSGETLVSFDAEAASAFGLGIGDTIGVNVLGREVVATIANLREIDWSSMSINFVMVFSPGLLANAPQSHIATVRAAAESERALERAVTDRFPNVSAIRVKEVLESVRDLVGKLAVAVRAIAAVALVAGTLVLAGAIAASHDRRVYDAVVLKVVGATRGDVTAIFGLEFALLGLTTAAIAGAVGTAAAWGVVTQVMKAEWVFEPSTMVVTAALATALTVGAGLAGTWAALGRKAAPLLRNE